MDYRVTWEIDIAADNPREAAAIALEIQRNAESHATVFEVFDDKGDLHEVDLMADDEKELFTNCYRCPGDLSEIVKHPPHRWSSLWSCMCNDECPVCHISDIEPYASEQDGDETIHCQEVYDLAQEEEAANGERSNGI